MNFSVTPVTRKKEPQQQLRFKMTTNEKTWNKKIKHTLQSSKKQKEHVTSQRKNTKRPNKKKSQASSASYVPDSHKYYTLETFLPPAPDSRACSLWTQWAATLFLPDSVQQNVEILFPISNIFNDFD